jgi:hypothetical protein
MSVKKKLSFNPLTGMFDYIVKHLPSGIVVGSYGSASQVPRFTVDANGHVTAVALQTINPTSLTFQNFTSTTDVTRTANTFAVVTSMVAPTPAAGTYLVLYNAETRVSNVNGRGEVAMFVGGVQQTVYTKAIELEVALLLGVIGSSILETGASAIIGTVPVNGSQDIDIRFRSVDGQTITIGHRSLTVVRVL